MKRAFDFSVSLVALTILAPLLLIVGLLVRLVLGSPVLWRQERPGLHGKPFMLYKFRTMTEARDAGGELLTSLGRWLRRLSLDEVPQLFNVLKGDMSLVGPRPLLMEYLPLYDARQARRHEVRPGVTGWAQVNGRNTVSWQQRFELDVWYVEHRSFWLDLKIIWLTLLRVVSGSGVNQPGQATMQKFRGNDR
jgi:sugar transferase EpsL